MPLQRVLVELPVLLRRHDLLAIQENRRYHDAQSRSFSLSEKDSCKTFGSRLGFLLCGYIATGVPVLVGMCNELAWIGLHLPLFSVITAVKPAFPNLIFHPLPMMHGVMAMSSPEL